MLDSAIKTQLKTYLERLQGRIELRASLDASPAADEVRELLHDISGLSALVHVREDGEALRRPSFEVGPIAETARVSFAGVPLGHEFTSLVLAMLQAARSSI